MLRFLTAGESHGPALTAIIEGLPAGLRVDVDRVNRMLSRRQGGAGSSARMSIESDQIIITAGLRNGETIGSPISITINNKARDMVSRITTPRPGHADLIGTIKYGRKDARDVLERASARETAARVAVGAICKEMLLDLGMDVTGYVVSIGEITAKVFDIDPEMSPVRSPDREAGENMMRLIEQARERGETLGGIIEVVGNGLPRGLGSYVHWDRRLDANIARAMMSVPAIKGVEIGLGFEASRRVGSEALDKIEPGYVRPTNHAGGIEGGMSNGEPVVVRCAMKPLSTLMNPLSTIDMDTGKVAAAVIERSDVCAVPRAAVVCEAVLAIELSSAVVEKFGGDRMGILRESIEKERI